MSPKGMRVFGDRGSAEVSPVETERRVMREDVMVRVYNSVEVFEKNCVSNSIQGWRLYSVQFMDDGTKLWIYAVWMMRSPRELTEDKPFG